MEFFTNNVTFQDLCEASLLEVPDGCDAGPVPGVVIGVLQSEGSGNLSADYEDFVRQFFSSVAEDESDVFGDASPSLYAYSVLKPEFGGGTPNGTIETVNAIVTSRAMGPPGDIPPAGRTVLVMNVTFDGDRWSLTRLTIGGGDYDPDIVRDFLEPALAPVEAIFDFWQPLELAPTP